MAIAEWEPPTTVTRLRAFLGFTNYYSGFVEGYAKIVSPLMDCLQVDKMEGKKGSETREPWGPEQRNAFDSIKALLCGNLLLQQVKSEKPFVLRTDASGYAVGASLEQMVDEVRMPTPEDVQQKKTVPVYLFVRKIDFKPKELGAPITGDVYHSACFDEMGDMDWSAANPCLNRSSGLGALG